MRRQDLISFRLPGSQQCLIFSETVLQQFRNHRQARFWHREAGGHLFAAIDGDFIEIVAATGPKKDDLRGRYSYTFDRTGAQEIIEEQFARNRHYVGDWHTHPQDRPRPSKIDLSTMQSRFHDSDHGLRGMIFCIVGRRDFPSGICVMVQTENALITL
jgi:integrative and conjugative element protein (TIGR02256 family)